MQSLKPGYAFQSTRKQPVDPQTVIISESDIVGCRYVGSSRIDGSSCARFKRPGMHTGFYFQLFTLTTD